MLVRSVSNVAALFVRNRRADARPRRASCLRRAAAGATLLGLSGLASATGTLTAGDSQLQLIGSGTSIFDSPANGDANWRLDAGGPDVLSKLTWYYRLQNNNQNAVFSAIDTPATSFQGPVGTATWLNAGPGASGLERFDATLKIFLSEGTAPGTGIIEQRMLVGANAGNAAARQYQFFFLLNLDVDATAAGDSTTLVDSFLLRIRQTDSSAPTSFAEALALRATNFQTGSASSLISLVNGGSGVFSQALSQSTSSDQAIGYQWTGQYNPGQTRLLVVKIGYGLPVCLADANNDGIISVQDIFAFLAFWFDGDVRGDFNADTFTTVQDIFDFLTQWFAGC
jgi:hypothetical protein